MSAARTTSTPAALTPPAPWTVGPVTRTDFVRYQGASGDMNPIHHDEEFARAAGFDAPFAVGMYQAGLLGTYATEWLGAENVRSFRIRFLEQVWPGDTLTATAEVVREYTADDGAARVDIELVCTRQTGGAAVKAWATFVVPDGGAGS
ncbi:MaoC/PaaZ C-terminal domain-containing protein [Tomitella gaofuii]|uniref:MaoC/PaaZ C-terminal domain-containing protein n=1 Tax=Tomitella gaofuii TaxID=2760083 RepID=UPI0015FBBDA3|nr:MaoC/PaaZ C-terminal domain-containing protein [Tomitella gaofuii]